MQLISYGAAREVTGSKHLLKVNGKNILLDCGMFQGHRQDADKKNRKLPIDPKKIDHIVISHAHMDHTGLLPLYVKNGYENEICATFATRDLCNYMLQDSAYIQEREAEYLSKKHKTAIPPLYDEEDVKKTLDQFCTIGYNRRHELTEGVSITFLEAGHILGSAQVFIEIDDKEDGKHKTLLFTGDLGRKGLPILRDPAYVPEADYLLCESTYGNRFHKYIADVDDYFEEIINRTVKRGGKILIPAFALERTQEVVYHLHLLMRQNRIPEIPIFVDSPLATNVTEVFKSHPECFDDETYKEFLKDDKNPFGFGRLEYTSNVEDSKRLNNFNHPCVIISASGMMEHGRILHHLKNNIENPANTVVVVGYQAENTLGRHILEKQKSVRIFGEFYNLRCDVEVIDAFSGHADRSDLLDHIAHIKEKPKKVFLVHGEENQGLTFGQILLENGYQEVYIPEFGRSYKL